MKITKVINFIVPLRIFSSRNMTSLGLVALFFLFYIIAGGGVGMENLKSLKNSDANRNFGGINEQTVVQTPPPVADNFPYPPAVEKQKDKENNKQEADAGWEKLNNKLKGFSEN